MHSRLGEIHRTLKSILIGMRITLKYCFAKTVTVQYPARPPTLQPRFRGFHWYEIEKCSACGSCARACPVDCIYIQNSGPRKIDKTTGTVRGGAMVRYAIDYSKCMFCGLCTVPCPTDCLHMGDIHDLSGYSRTDAVVEFTELARQGLRTPVPAWMRKRELPDWARARQDAWIERAQPAREEMAKALIDTTPPKKPLTPAVVENPPAAPASGMTAPGPAAAPPPAGPAPSA
jgi:NADH-quinone oxidoreductase subunit I